MAQAEETPKLEETLQRYPTMSDVLYQKISENEQKFLEQYNECILHDGRIKRTKSGYYWNSIDTIKIKNTDRIVEQSQQHFSFHPGGSKSKNGATHYKFDFDSAPEVTNKTPLVARIYIYDTIPYELQNDTDSVFGNHIYVDLTNVKKRHEDKELGDEYYNIMSIINIMTNCFAQTIEQYFSLGNKGKTQQKLQRNPPKSFQGFKSKDKRRNSRKNSQNQSRHKSQNQRRRNSQQNEDSEHTYRGGKLLKKRKTLKKRKH